MAQCDALDTVRRALSEAEREAGRPAGSVELLAVSKQQPVDRIAACHAHGQRRFAESYLQEAAPKIEALADLDIEWHFIGRLQSNKTAEVARRFDWVQSIDRLKLARRLSRQRPAMMPPLDVCVQINISADPAKAGVEPEAALGLCQDVAVLPNLRLRGLMAIPAVGRSQDERLDEFRRLRVLFDALRGSGLALDTLSMGMSADFVDAVMAGATMVRIGSALFGQRRG